MMRDGNRHLVHYGTVADPPTQADNRHAADPDTTSKPGLTAAAWPPPVPPVTIWHVDH